MIFQYKVIFQQHKVLSVPKPGVQESLKVFVEPFHIREEREYEKTDGVQTELSRRMLWCPLGSEQSYHCAAVWISRAIGAECKQSAGAEDGDW